MPIIRIGDGDPQIRITRPGFENIHKHHVRSPAESQVCCWLMDNNIAHRNAPEAFSVRLDDRRVETYVPDIILHDKDRGKSILVEVFQSKSSKRGGPALLAGFRSQSDGEFSLILVVRRNLMGGIRKDAYDHIVET